MAPTPTTTELVAAVREFVTGLRLEGRDAFHAKVAANVLAIVERELAAAAPLATGPLAAFARDEAALCAAIRAGTLDAATPGLLAALTTATLARLAIDNPRYPTLARLAEAAAPTADAAVRR